MAKVSPEWAHVPNAICYALLESEDPSLALTSTTIDNNIPHHPYSSMAQVAPECAHVPDAICYALLESEDPSLALVPATTVTRKGISESSDTDGLDTAFQGATARKVYFLGGPPPIRSRRGCSAKGFAAIDHSV